MSIQEIKPIALPPPPPPAEVIVTKLDAEFSQRLAEYREANPKNELLFIGATVFRSKDSSPRTLVRWWPQGGNRTITFWSSADFALIAGGINSFADTAGDPHHMLMGWGNVDLDRMAELFAAKGREYDATDLPDFLEGKATFKVGHILVGAGHPDRGGGDAPLIGTDRTQRLMSNGPGWTGNSLLLVKREWDKAEVWLRGRPNGDN